MNVSSVRPKVISSCSAISTMELILKQCALFLVGERTACLMLGLTRRMATQFRAQIRDTNRVGSYGRIILEKKKRTVELITSLRVRHFVISISPRKAIS